MKLEKKLKFTINSSEYIFRTLTREDVSQSYVDALKQTRGLIENVPEDIDIGWQQSYIKKVLLSPCDTICGLFLDSALIGTAGIQNLTVAGIVPRAIEMAVGYTCGCTIGIFIPGEISRGRGYGKTLVWAACYLANNCGGVEAFEASVKKNNVPSLKSFSTCGFKVTKEGADGVNIEVKIGELVKPAFVERVAIEGDDRSCPVRERMI
jgi:RimJ/RimL family protein N-acetyltransferase